MKNVLAGLVCFLAGGAAGYFVAKRKYKKKIEQTIESINETQKELDKKREEKNAVEKSTDISEDEDINGHVDVYKLAEEEKESGEDEDEESEEELYYDDYDERSRVEFESKFEDYYGTNIPYPITQATYDEKDGTHFKRRMIIYAEEDKAYDADSGEEFENFHASIGDEDYDTLNEDNAVDFFGVWHIRNDKEGFDYEVEYGNRALDSM